MFGRKHHTTTTKATASYYDRLRKGNGMGQLLEDRRTMGLTDKPGSKYIGKAAIEAVESNFENLNIANLRYDSNKTAKSFVKMLKDK